MTIHSTLEDALEQLDAIHNQFRATLHAEMDGEDEDEAFFPSAEAFTANMLETSDLFDDAISRNANSGAFRAMSEAFALLVSEAEAA